MSLFALRSNRMCFSGALCSLNDSWTQWADSKLLDNYIERRINECRLSLQIRHQMIVSSRNICFLEALSRCQRNLWARETRRINYSQKRRWQSAFAKGSMLDFSCNDLEGNNDGVHSNLSGPDLSSTLSRRRTRKRSVSRITACIWLQGVPPDMLEAGETKTNSSLSGEGSIKHSFKSFH